MLEAADSVDGLLAGRGAVVVGGSWDVTGWIFVAAGGFVRELTRPTPAFLGYHDHHDCPPWSLEELRSMIPG